MADAAIDHLEALQKAREGNPQMPNAQQSHPGGLHMHGSAASAERVQDSGDGNHTDRLEAARKGGISQTAKVAKDLASVVTPAGAFSLFKQIDFLADMPYVAALGAAMLKDLLDMVAAETVILSVIFSALCTIFIFMMMMLVGSGGKKKVANNLLKKIGILGVGGIADSVPGVDFFPIESITVVAIYVMALVDRKNAQQ